MEAGRNSRSLASISRTGRERVTRQRPCLKQLVLDREIRKRPFEQNKEAQNLGNWFMVDDW